MRIDTKISVLISILKTRLLVSAGNDKLQLGQQKCVFTHALTFTNIQAQEKIFSLIPI